MTISEALDYLAKHRAEVSIVPVGGRNGVDYLGQVAFPYVDGPWDYEFPGEDGGHADFLIHAAERHHGG